MIVEEVMRTLGRAGWGPMTKSWSGVEVYRQPNVHRGVGDTKGSRRDTKDDVADTHCIAEAHRRGEREVGSWRGPCALIRSTHKKARLLWGL